MKFPMQPVAPWGHAIPDPRLEMPALLYPGRKPAGAVTVDRSHPIGAEIHKNAWFIYRPKTLQNVYKNEVIRTTRMTLTEGGSKEPYIGSTGALTKDGSTGGGADYFVATEGFNSTFNAVSAATFVFCGYRRFKASNGDHQLCGESEGGYACAMVMTLSGIKVRINSGSYATYRTVEVTLPDDSTTKHCVVFVWNGGGDLKAYQNGVEVGTTTETGTPTTTKNSSSVKSQIFSSGSYTQGAAIDMMIGLPIAISEGLAKSLSHDPYQFLTPA
jgi:hypothetical protein